MHSPGPTSHPPIRPGFTLRCMVLSFVTSTQDLLRPLASQRDISLQAGLYPPLLSFLGHSLSPCPGISLIIYSWDSYTSHSSAWLCHVVSLKVSSKRLVPEPSDFFDVTFSTGSLNIYLLTSLPSHSGMTFRGHQFTKMGGEKSRGQRESKNTG